MYSEIKEKTAGVQGIKKGCGCCAVYAVHDIMPDHAEADCIIHCVTLWQACRNDEVVLASSNGIPVCVCSWPPCNWSINHVNIYKFLIFDLHRNENDVRKC